MNIIASHSNFMNIFNIMICSIIRINKLNKFIFKLFSSCSICVYSSKVLIINMIRRIINNNQHKCFINSNTFDIFWIIITIISFIYIVSYINNK